jgi:SAM-dependent methyltransferase
MRVTFLFLAACLPALSQAAAEANAAYRSEEGRQRMVATLDGEHRDARQRPCYMLPHLSQAVGPTGKVFAEDIFPDFLARARKKGEPLGNVEFFLGDEKSPKLPANSVDLVLILDAYHHFDYPESMLAGIRSALKSGGRLAIVDYYKRRGAMSNPNPDFALSHIRLDDAGVVREIEANGFKLVKNSEFLAGSQYLAILKKR